MKRTVTATTFLWIWVFGAAVTSAQPALKRLEDLIRRQGGGEPTEGVRNAPQEPGEEADQQVPEGAEQVPPEQPVPKKGYLGVVADDGESQGRGVRILEVLPGGPADKAGLRSQDLITGQGGVRVRAMSEMATILEGAPVGGKLLFEILRGANPQQIEVTLGRRPPPQKRRFKTLPPPADLPPVPPIKPLPDTRPVAPEESLAAAQGLTARIEMLEERVEELLQRVELLELALEAARAGRWGTMDPATHPATMPIPVTVTVTLNGEAVEGARVIFVPVARDADAAFGLTDATGKAKLTTFETGDGAVPGSYRVSISKTLVHGTGAEAELRYLLPAKYASPETSAFTAEVVSGANDFAFDLKD